MLAYPFVCQTSWHLGHMEVRGGNNRTQSSTALCGKDDEIMALCMVTDTGFISSLCKSALGRFAVSITFFSSLSPCFPYIVAYVTSMLDVFSSSPPTSDPRNLAARWWLCLSPQPRNDSPTLHLKALPSGTHPQPWLARVTSFKGQA